jgi:hypothetical protein
VSEELGSRIYSSGMRLMPISVDLSHDEKLMNARNNKIIPGKKRSFVHLIIFNLIFYKNFIIKIGIGINILFFIFIG